MENFSELFEAMVSDHGSRPRNFQNVERATHRAEGVNPLSGDQLTFEFEVDGEERIKSAGFAGKASALATTSASVMTTQLKGKTLPEVREFIEQTLNLIAGEEELPENLPDDEYRLLLEVRQFPNRVPCVALAWRTAKSALA